jgi:ribonucleoside-diphosphate reductase beta chain
MLLAFASREGIHQRAYALFTDTLGLPDSTYSEFLEYEEMASKIELMQKNDATTQAGKAKALAQTVCNEGMSLFSSFVMLLNFQRYGKALGLCKITEWSLRDETQHVEGMSELFKIFCSENPGVLTDSVKAEIYQYYRDAVALEDAFIDTAFKIGTPDGLTAAEMKQYIRFIANRRLRMIGFKDNWTDVQNPFPWLDWILAEGHTNFFEQRVSEYSVAGLTGNWEY